MRYLLFSLLILFFLIPISVNGQPYLNENSTWQENLTAIYYSSIILGDIDDNSYLDILMIGKSENGILTQIYTNNGTSFKENSTWKDNLTNVHYGSIAFGDIDNDGDLDLVLTGCSSGGGYSENCDDNKQETFIYINNGTSFVENATWQQNVEKVWRGSISFGDIDNDGDLDLVLTGQSMSGRVSKIYVNNGTSFVENATWQQNLTAVDSSSVTFGDIDNDGDLDLLLTGRDSSFQKTAKIYLNNRTSFVENATWQQNLVKTEDSAITIGDIDNDGDIDISLIGCCDMHRTYNNNGSTFQEVQSEIADFVGVFSGSNLFGDYDNDGYLDIITTGRETYTALYSNYGNCTFTDYWNRPEQQISPLEYSSLVWGDLDNDLDIDLILTGWGNPGDWYQRRVYINNITSGKTIPSNPSSNFNSSFNFSTGKLSLSWGNGSDVETPTLGLYYNLRVGTCSGCHDVISGVFGGGDDNGYFGNMMQRKSIVLNRPDLENKTIYWSVQTIDTGLAKSNWSEEQVYEIVQLSPPCIENWIYGEWSECIGGQQSRSATDFNSCGTYENRSDIVRSCSEPTPSGGPSSSPPPVISSPPEEEENEPGIPEDVTGYFEKIGAGERIDIILNETGNAVSGVNIKVKNEITGVIINITRLDSKPDSIPPVPEAEIYQYLNITNTNLSDDNIENGSIDFRVEKEWIENNSINKTTVQLLRYHVDGWQELDTIIVNEDSDFIYYHAETPGFSVFAIYGKILEEPEMICIPTNSVCDDTKVMECSTDGTEWKLKEECENGCENGTCKEKPNGNTGLDYLWVIVPIIIIIAIAGLYFYKTKKSRVSGSSDSSLS
ncbi:MAG: VCBS repeat-containing protein [Candidatus Aenigmarchaeota archaeon]|nr:VCBS repeat-containing protein [Candidatus Aenigmarchaeota archaeon]